MGFARNDYLARRRKTKEIAENLLSEGKVDRIEYDGSGWVIEIILLREMTEKTDA